MDDFECDGYEMEVVPVKVVLEKKSGITFKGSGEGYLEAHRIIKLMTGTKGDRFLKNGVEMTILDTPKNKPIKVEIKLKNGISGKANLKIFEINRNGGATMMVQKVSGGDFLHVKTLGLKVLKHIIDGVIDGKITEKDVDSCKRKVSRRAELGKTKSLNRECKSHLCQSCEKTFTTLQGLNLHVGHIHRTEMDLKCDICKYTGRSREELNQHKLSSHTISESPNSKKIKIDLTDKQKITESVIKVDEKVFESMMDIDREEDETFLTKQNDENILMKQKLNEEEEKRIKLLRQNEEEVDKKRKRQISTDKRKKKKSTRKNKSKEENNQEEKMEVKEDTLKEETDISLGYMGWQIDEEEGQPKNRTFLAFQKVFNDLRSDYTQTKEKVEGLEKSSLVQKNNFAKLNKEFNSLKNEYKECVEALRKETEERTKAESTVTVLKEIIESKEEMRSEEDRNSENMEIDDALGVWITQQKRKPVKLAKSLSKTRKCENCEETFSNETELSNHSREHKRDLQNSNQWQKTFAHSSGMENHAIKHKKDLLVCKSCEKKFETEQEVKDHEKEHKTRLILNCTKCGEKFSNKEQLSRHTTKHEVNHQFNCECDVCDRRFEAKINMDNHKTTHTQVPDHKCCKCDKIYSTMNKLRRHDWRSHRSIDCNICGENLESRDQISTHRKIVHKMFKRIKCKFFPNCLDEDECFFIHEDTSSIEITDNQHCLEGENCKEQSCEFSVKEHKTVFKDSFLGSRSQVTRRK